MSLSWNFQLQTWEIIRENLCTAADLHLRKLRKYKYYVKIMHDLEACARFKVQPHSFLTSALDTGLSSTASSRCFTPGENVPGTQVFFKSDLIG